MPTPTRKVKYRPDNLHLPLSSPSSPTAHVDPLTNQEAINPEEVIRAIEASERCIKWEDLQIGVKLGSGAFGTVQKVSHTINDVKTDYAMKKVTLEKTDLNNPKNIIAEFKALYECKSENIINMFDAFYREGSIFMVMEYMDCGSLEDLMKTCKVVPELALSWISCQILKGLVYLHEEKGIVHRDIKPANILINSKGVCKIADFGMSGHNKDKSNNEAKSWDTFQGTYTYMSPERIKGGKHSFNSDIWSVGLTLAECALGTFPFQLTENTIWEMMKHLEESDAEPISLPKDKFSDDFREFIFACLKFDQEERLSARELLEYNFIKKHTTSVKLKRWVYENYIEKRRAAAQNAVTQPRIL